MKKELNYPIKYAVLELKEKGGWSVGYADVTQGFIASKCYVIESSTVYYADGSNKKIYKVVFPFSDIGEFKKTIAKGSPNVGKAEAPRVAASGSICPISIVTDLFDTYDSAKEAAEEKNDDYRRHLSVQQNVPINYYMASIDMFRNALVHEFDSTLEICKFFEQEVLLATDDMPISEEMPKVIQHK